MKILTISTYIALFGCSYAFKLSAFNHQFVQPANGFGRSLAQSSSIPNCNSATRPDCVKKAKTAAHPLFEEDIRDIMNDH